VIVTAAAAAAAAGTVEHEYSVAPAESLDKCIKGTGITYKKAGRQQQQQQHRIKATAGRQGPFVRV
jgi:hypothetical protein